MWRADNVSAQFLGTQIDYEGASPTPGLGLDDEILNLKPEPNTQAKTQYDFGECLREGKCMLHVGECK